jgi:phospholipid N-methyltransferase
MWVEIMELLGAMAARINRTNGNNERITFLQEFLKHPQEVASIIPSSRFLERRIVKLGGVSSAKTLVELGSGTGGTTRAILRAMRPDAHLLSIEINPGFHQAIKQIPDARLIAHLGSAGELQKIIAFYNLDSPDVVISGIPFSIINPNAGSQIIREVSAALAPGGRFVAYQFRDRVESLSRPFLGPAQVELELLNIPPVRIYRWERPNA